MSTPADDVPLCCMPVLQYGLSSNINMEVSVIKGSTYFWVCLWLTLPVMGGLYCRFYSWFLVVILKKDYFVRVVANIVDIHTWFPIIEVYPCVSRHEVTAYHTDVRLNYNYQLNLAKPSQFCLWRLVPLAKNISAHTILQ